MLFIVPDDTDDSAAAGAPEEGLKAQLDDGGEASRGAKKVDLDLDDAPFLEEEEEEQPEPEPEAMDVEPEKPARQLPAWIKNKFLWIAVAVILVAMGVVVKFLFLNKPEPAPPPPVEEKKAEVPPPPEPVEQVKPKDEGETILRLDPFWVEQRDKDGAIRFLVVRIVFSTKDQNLAKNLTQETLTVRNAVYYYLKNKDLQYLADEKNAERLKKELLTVVNQYMGAGQFENLLFEEYVVK